MRRPGRKPRVTCAARSRAGTYPHSTIACAIPTSNFRSPYRAPELLFGPLTYDARATDLWSLGATLASFYTPLRFTSDFYEESFSDSDTDDEVEGEGENGKDIPKPFVFPATGTGEGAEFGTWTRDTLFNADRGEIALAWSIFKVLGTPNETSWPVSLLSN